MFTNFEGPLGLQVKPYKDPIGISGARGPELRVPKSPVPIYWKICILFRGELLYLQRFKIIYFLMGPWGPRAMIHMGPREHWEWLPSSMFLFMGKIKIRPQDSGGRLNIKLLSYQHRDPHLIFNMGIPIPGEDSLYIETGPR